jgi:hypothetical protein
MSWVTPRRAVDPEKGRGPPDLTTHASDAAGPKVLSVETYAGPRYAATGDHPEAVSPVELIMRRSPRHADDTPAEAGRLA